MIAAVSLLILSVTGAKAQTPAYKNPSLPVEVRLKDLLGRMTVEEKIDQLRSDADPKVFLKALGTTGWGFIPLYGLRGTDPAAEAKQINEWQKIAQTSRLGIPVMPYEESLHGLIDKGHTSFPQAIALAATWDPALIHQVAKSIAAEDRSNGVRQVLSPVINVCRDARWGREEESYGEDPYLQSQIAVAFVSELEGAGVVTTPKHYIANVWDGGRDSNAVEISDRSLFDVYLPPFKAVFAAGSRSVMCSYNAMNGVPCACDPWLLTDVLRGSLGFKGYVVSDWGAASNVMDRFQVVKTPAECAAALVNAGMEAEHPTVYISRYLDEAVSKGLISMKTLDQAAGRILRVKFEIGLFENPFVDPDKAAAEAINPEHTAIARTAAERAMVLLKNDHNTLPLSADYKNIAVFGDFVNDPVPLGGYSGTGNVEHRKSILQGLKDHSPSVNFNFVSGCSIGNGVVLPVIPTSALQTPDGKPGLKAEFFNNQNLEGAPALTRTDSTVDFDWVDEAPSKGFQQTHYSIRWSGFITAPEAGDYDISGTSDDGMRIYVDGKMIVDDWSDHPATTVLGRVHLDAGVKAPIRIDYYQNTGEASARVGWKLSSQGDMVSQQAAQAASSADANLVFVGIKEGEGSDRAYLNLPGNQEDVIKAVAKSGKPTIVVIVAGGAVTMEGWVDQVPAILDAWYPGQEGADAIARVLCGDANPSGKLPFTFPKTIGQCPLYYNFEPSGRGYDYVNSSGSPLFAFGHGLSYTKFEYSKLAVTPHDRDSRAANPGLFWVTFDINNTGDREGTEVPQLYLYEETASVIRPLKALKGFQAVSLKPGESKVVTLALTADDLSLWNTSLQRELQPGTFDIMVGSSSDDIRLKGKLEVTQKMFGEKIPEHVAKK
ncbi:MAG TPA: glycoside hydrolase family 3 N-terminal domain-containing protein [Fimbriimonadaceae bacterium]|jgi:beta-glucosidase